MQTGQAALLVLDSATGVSTGMGPAAGQLGIFLTGNNKDAGMKKQINVTVNKLTRNPFTVAEMLNNHFKESVVIVKLLNLNIDFSIYLKVL